jgi:3-isopropylmalate dehydrogenase
MRCYNVALLPGDGIGPEVVAEAVKVLNAVEKQLEGTEFRFQEFAVGAGEYLRSGEALSRETLEAIRPCDAILLGAMGLPHVRKPDGTEIAPQLDLREQLDLYCGLRPVYLYHPDHSPLKGYVKGKIDLVVFRENTEGFFSSRLKTFPPDAQEVTETLRVSRRGSIRIFQSAFREAARRRKLVTLVDKANALPAMSFFRRIFEEVSKEFPEVRTEKLYVDAASLHLIQRPQTFDVIVTENLFGDILSELAAGLVGGVGMAASGDIGDRYAVFQPIHGSAPAALMLDWLNHPQTVRGAAMIRCAVEKVYDRCPHTTADLGGSLGTFELGDLIAAAIGS